MKILSQGGVSRLSVNQRKLEIDTWWDKTVTNSVRQTEYIWKLGSGIYKAKASTNGNVEQKVISTVTDFIPGVSNVKAGYETVFGVEIITGRELDSWERALAGARIITGPKSTRNNENVNHPKETWWDKTITNRLRQAEFIWKVGSGLYKAKASNNKDVEREMTSIAADLAPGISNVKAGYETVFASDPITGRELESWERALAGAGIIGGPLIKGVKHGGKLIKGSVKPVSNMNEFFDMEFGKSISKSLSKSKVKYDGQSIYKIEKKTDNSYLKKGYGVYLDALHKDHLEVIDKTGNVKYVLNLDGTLNPDKTKKALGRVVKGWR
ncbi:pre-toxin TG domain-containing protein [Salipaludibacillus sp. HK11]|uniref:pre-toxin TG domain-containing protein n=1 Tax=Salipaludibacillus sp. HK11 TaxID=3394320 RepID=UPI0039FD8AE2